MPMLTENAIVDNRYELLPALELTQGEADLGYDETVVKQFLERTRFRD